MTRLLAVVGVLALACGASAVQFRPAPQPKAAPSKGEAAKRLVEEVEAIEAHLQTKHAYIRAAQVALKAAELTLDRVGKLGGPLDEAKLALEAAKAQLTIREAEANEVAVKLKHAKRRAEDTPKAEASAKLAEVKAAVEKSKAELATADAELKRLVDLAKRGIVAQADLDAAVAKHRQAKEQVDALTALADRLQRMVDE